MGKQVEGSGNFEKDGHQMVLNVTERRKSPSAPTRKSPRLEKQVEVIGNTGKEGHQMATHGPAVVNMGNKSKENDSVPVDVNGNQSSLQCTKCQFKAKTEWNFERHVGSKTHKNRVAIEVAGPAEVITSGTQSKAGEEVEKTVGGAKQSSTGTKSKGAGETVSQEDTESVRTTNSSTGAIVSDKEVIASGAVSKSSNCGGTVSQEENILGAVPIFKRLNTSRASAREARTRCASMLKE